MPKDFKPQTRAFAMGLESVSKPRGWMPKFRVEWPKWQASRLHLASWLAILLWAAVTVFLLDYYLSTSGISSLSPFAGSYNLSHAALSADETRAMGLDTRPALGEYWPTEGMRRLMEMRRIQKNGGYAGLSLAASNLREFVGNSGAERYKMIWAPMIACAQSSCSNPAYLRAAGLLAALDVRLAGHAMVVEAVYWYEAQKSGDSAAAAAAVVRLDDLVRRYPSPELKARWMALQECRGTCPLFEEQLLDFIEEAAKI